MGVADNFGAGKATTVNDGGVVEFVGEDDIFAPDKGGDGRQVGAEAALETDDGFRAFKLRQFLLQLQVQLHRPCDSPNGTRTDAKFVNGFLGGFLQRGVVAKAEIVIGAQVQHALPVHYNPSPLRAFQRPNGHEQPFLLKRFKLLRDEGKGRPHHRPSPSFARVAFQFYGAFALTVVRLNAENGACPLRASPHRIGCRQR